MDTTTAAVAVTGPWTLAALLISGLGAVVTEMKVAKPEARRWLFALAALIAVVGLIPVMLALTRTDEPYRLAVQARDPEGKVVPASELQVDASVRGLQGQEAKGTILEVTLNPAQMPADRKITLVVRDEAQLLSGEVLLSLAGDRNPSAPVTLHRQTTHAVHGYVEDQGKKRLAGIAVTISGFSSDTATTDNHGEFVTAPRFALGESVHIHAESAGLTTFPEHDIVSEQPLPIRLSR